MNILQYKPGQAEHDWALINWHTRLLHDKEFSHTFTNNMKSPSTFISFFFLPRLLFCVLDDLSNIEMAYWIDPSMSGVFVGMWADASLRQSIRGNRKIYEFFCIMTEEVLKSWPVIISTIKDRESKAKTDKFIEMHKKLGYNYIGKIPYLFDKEPANILYLTEENFQAAYVARRR